MHVDAVVGDDVPAETEEFWARVRTLPKRQAQAIALFYLEDRPVAEIAVILGCAESTARKHLSRGRRSLQRVFRVDQ
jgi:RNA polymerase sigma-70 factor (ECF subfamily)